MDNYNNTAKAFQQDAAECSRRSRAYLCGETGADLRAEVRNVWATNGQREAAILYHSARLMTGAE